MELRSLGDRPAVAGSEDDAGVAPTPSGDGDARAEPEPETQRATDAEEQEGVATGQRWANRIAWGSLAVVLVPLVVSAVRAIATGWVPVGDSALIAVRARDVLGGGPGGDVPLLGMWASASWEVGFDVNHPGPLLYDALAVPAALVGGGAGLVLGTLGIAVAAVTGIFVAARRVAGPAAATAAMAVTALLCWSIGSEALIEPWHAGTVLLPFLCFAALTWAVLAGDSLCLPWAVVAGSLVLSTNLSYTVLVPVLLLAATGAVAVTAWRGRTTGWRREGVALGTAALVAVLCWIQPLIEQLSRDDGNLSRLVRTEAADRSQLGWAGARAVAEVVALPPWWASPSYADAFHLGPFGNDLPGAAPAALALAALAGLIGLAAWSGRRDRDRPVVAAAAVAGLLLAAALVSGFQSPTSDYGTIAYQLRWLWPVGAFVTLALLVAVVRHRWPARVRAWWPAAALSTVAAVAAAATLPTANHGTTAPPGTYPVAREITDAVAAADLPERVRVICYEGVFDPYCEAVMAELQDRGTGFVVADHVGLRQLGQGRHDPGGLPRIVVVAGELATLPRDGVEVVASHAGLDEDERLELFYLREQLKGALDAGEIRLSDVGEQAAARGNLMSIARRDDGWHIDPAAALDLRPSLYGTHRRDLVALVREDLLDTEPEWRAPLARYVELQDRADEATVAVYLYPPP